MPRRPPTPPCRPGRPRRPAPARAPARPAGGAPQRETYDLERRAVDLDDPLRVAARLLVQPVDVLRHERVAAGRCARGRPGRGARRWAPTPTWVRSGGSATPAGAARGPPRRPGGSPSSRPRGSWSTHPAARGSRGCPSRSRCRPPSARRRAGTAPAGHGRPPSPWRPWWHAYAAGCRPWSSCSRPPTPRTASAGPPGRWPPGAVGGATGSPSRSAPPPTSSVRCWAPPGSASSRSCSTPR